MVERGIPLVLLRSAALSRLSSHASTTGLTSVATRPSSWPSTNGYLLLTNFRSRDEEFVGLNAYDCSFWVMSFARAKKGEDDPDVLALTNASLAHEALTSAKLTLSDDYAMVSLVPRQGEGIPSEDDGWNYFTVPMEFHSRIDFTG